VSAASAHPAAVSALARIL